MATERNSGRSSQRLKKRQTSSDHSYEELRIRISGSSSEDIEAIVDLIVKEQFINACSEELAVYVLERGPKKTKSTIQSKHAEQRRQTQSKLDTTLGRQRSLQYYKCQGYGHRQSECVTKVSPSKDQKSSTPVGQSNQKKTSAMMVRSNQDSEEAFTCVNVENSYEVETPKKVIQTYQLVKMMQYTMLLAVPRVMMVRPTLR